MIKLNDLSQKQDGLILVAVLVIIAVLTLVGLALLSQATSQFTLTSAETSNVNALYTAEAGIEESIQQLNQNSDFSGYATDQQFFNNAQQGYGIYTTTITPSTQNSTAKIITSTGDVYNYFNHSDLVASRIVEVTAVGTASPGYSVESGPGGLILNGSASITNSSVYVNGTITLNGSSNIGTVSQPLDVYAANDACPSGSDPGSTYPTVCTDGSQPISMARSTHIYGSVCATGQTSTGPNNNIQGGNGGQGLETGCTAPTVSMPAYNRSAQIDAVTTTASGTSNDYVCNSWPFNRTWPGNLELTGDVNLGSNCTIDLKGNVYITGNLVIDGAATINVDNSLGTTRPVILVDGTITVGGSSAIQENSSGTGVEFISFDSNASCGSTCTSLSGNALYDTSTFQTVTVGGAAKVPGSIFYAYWGETVLEGSGNVGSAAGLTVSLSGAGTVTFGTTLSSGTSTWTISSYQIKYPGG